MRLNLIWPFCLFLGACASDPEVNMPVGVACVPRNLGAAPEYSDSDEALAAAADAAGRYVLLIIGREERKARSAEVEPVVAACAQAPA